MTVSDVLEERLHRRDAPGALTAILSISAHAAFVVALILVSRPRPRTLPLFEALPVRVVSPGSLGRRTAPRPAPAAEKARPAIEKLQKDDTPKPSEKALPLPKAAKEKPRPAPKPERSATAPAPSEEGVELPSAGGNGAAGSGSGSDATGLSFGASLAGFDADFPYAYYAEQLQSLIGANWFKPNVPDGTACVISFSIQRSGQVTDVKVEESSGLPYYDRAATRAIYSANPLPPLPREFQREVLGVHIKFQ